MRRGGRVKSAHGTRTQDLRLSDGLERSPVSRKSPLQTTLGLAR
jgi:hypothetical protein